jgi:hypothetical protein
VPRWTAAELSDVIDALCLQYGVPLGGGHPLGDARGDAGDAPVDAGGAKRKGGAAAAGSGAGSAAAGGDAERERPAQQLLKAVGAAFEPRVARLRARDAAAAVRLMTALEVAPPAALLARYCGDAARGWRQLADGELVAAPAALAAVGAGAPDGEWLRECADEVLSRCVWWGV